MKKSVDFSLTAKQSQMVDNYDYNQPESLNWCSLCYYCNTHTVLPLRYLTSGQTVYCNHCIHYFIHDQQYRMCSKSKKYVFHISVDIFEVRNIIKAES
jgi:hypothetical protein